MLLIKLLHLITGQTQVRLRYQRQTVVAVLLPIIGNLTAAGADDQPKILILSAALEKFSPLPANIIAKYTVKVINNHYPLSCPGSALPCLRKQSLLQLLRVNHFGAEHLIVVTALKILFQQLRLAETAATVNINRLTL